MVSFLFIFLSLLECIVVDRIWRGREKRCKEFQEDSANNNPSKVNGSSRAWDELPVTFHSCFFVPKNVLSEKLSFNGYTFCFVCMKTNKTPVISPAITSYQRSLHYNCKPTWELFSKFPRFLWQQEPNNQRKLHNGRLPSGLLAYRAKKFNKATQTDKQAEELSMNEIEGGVKRCSIHTPPKEAWGKSGVQRSDTLVRCLVKAGTTEMYVKVDWASRVLFPLSFGLFNVSYWYALVNGIQAAVWH